MNNSNTEQGALSSPRHTDKPFHMAFEHIQERRDIGYAAKALYGVLHSLAQQQGHCYAGNEYLAQKMGLGYDTEKEGKASARCLQNWLNELAAVGLIAVVIDRAGKHQRRIYLTTTEKGVPREDKGYDSDSAVRQDAPARLRETCEEKFVPAADKPTEVRKNLREGTNNGSPGYERKFAHIRESESENKQKNQRSSLTLSPEQRNINKGGVSKFREALMAAKRGEKL